jgi:hypothetical protein
MESLLFWCVLILSFAKPIRNKCRYDASVV